MRIQLRRDTAINWETNNPILYPGEFGLETDTLKMKVGPVPVSGVGTAWNSITQYVNTVPADIANTLGDYVLLSDIGGADGVVGLNPDKNAIIPGSSIIIEGATDNAYETTLVATDPTADRTITLPDTTGTVALESYVDDAIAAFDALPIQTGNDGKFLQTTGSTTQWATVDLSTKQDKVTGVSDTEIGYLDGVTSAIQTQINSKAPLDSPTFTGTVILPANTISQSMMSDDSVGTNEIGGLAVTNEKLAGSIGWDKLAISSTVSSTEAGYLDGVTSAIQTQINNKAPLASPVFTGGISITDGAGLVSEGLVEAYGGLYVSGNTTIDGDLLVNGVTTSINTANTSVADNMIYLNEAITYTITDATGDGTNQVYTTSVDHDLTTSMVVRITGMNPSGYNKSSYVAITAVTADSFTVLGSETGLFVAGGEVHGKSNINPDLGISGGYNDGTYHHTGLFRDASDGKWKFFQGYELEPSGAFIDTSDASFALAPLKVAEFEASSITVGDVSNTEIGYLNGVTSAIQTQLDDKSTASKTETFTNKTLTSPKINEDVALTATATELNYVDGVTSAIQTQLDSKIAKTLVDAKGDILVGSADNTVTRLGVGTNGYLLTANSSATNGVEWAAAPVSLPDQTSNGNKYLKTDGTSASWATIPTTSQATSTTLGTVYGIDNSNRELVALGKNALNQVSQNNSLSYGNVAVGYASLQNAVLGSSYNIAMGSISLGYLTTGDRNVAIGRQAGGGTSLLNINDNVFIGDIAGLNNNGSNNIIIGSSANGSDDNVSNEITLGNSSITRFRVPGIGLDVGKTYTLSSNTATTIDEIEFGTWSSIEYLVSLKQGSKVRTSKVILQTNSTDVDMTEYAITETGGTMSGVTITAAVGGIGTAAALKLTVTDASSTNVTVKLSKVVL